MRLKLGIVMDPIASINPKKDTSFAMLLEAQRRGYEIFYMEMGDLYLDQGKPMALVRRLHVQDNLLDWYSLGSTSQSMALTELDAILMRKDPPFDSQYLYATQMLELAERGGTLVVNKPQALRDCNEKLYTAWFAELCPATLVTRQPELIREFHAKYQDVILKPLDGMGGASIFRIDSQGLNLGVVIETLTHHGSRYAMVQEYLPAIADGDKRVLVVDGKVVPYCLARLPSKGETRGNLAAGGTGRAQPISESDRRIAETVAPSLVEKGLLFVGLDIIGDKLTEINVTSPTCVREIEAAYPISITGMLFDAIEKRRNTHK